MKPRRNDTEAVRRIAAKFTALREARGEFQKVVARATGLNIGLLETGRRNFTLCTIDRLCRYYRVFPGAGNVILIKGNHGYQRYI